MQEEQAFIEMVEEAFGHELDLDLRSQMLLAYHKDKNPENSGTNQSILFIFPEYCLSTRYLDPGTRSQVPGTRYLVLGSMHQVPGTRKRVIICPGLLDQS